MLKVLAVDDEPDIVTFMTSWIARKNHTVDGETDGARVLERVRQYHYDLVLLDLVMPSSNGLSLITQIKEESPGTVVAVVSANLDERIAVLATKEGSDMCLPKPISGSDLDQVLRIVEHRRKGLINSN